MPKQISTEELDSIVKVVTGHPEGVGVEKIREGLPFGLPPRTLQRRLKRLEKDGRIRRTGTGKGTRYFQGMATTSGSIAEALPDIIEDSATDRGWLSLEAKEIRRMVTLPISKRRPVGYDPSFLTSYQPNTTFYLPLAARTRLAEMGQVGITDLPAGTYLRQILGATQK